VFTDSASAGCKSAKISTVNEAKRDSKFGLNVVNCESIEIVLIMLSIKLVIVVFVCPVFGACLYDVQ
jgi:hypothetical protein